MSSEIHIRQLLYFKSTDCGNLANQTQYSQRGVTTFQHKLSRFRSTGQSDFRLLTLNTQTPQQNFRYGFDVDGNQNPNSQIHFLESYEHPLKHINSYINESKRNVAQLKDQANKIRLELNGMQSKHEKEMNTLQTQFIDAIQFKKRLLKEDNVLFLDQQYRMNKEYLRLMKSKMLMEEKQRQLEYRVIQLEKILQGVTLELQQ